MCIRMYAYVSRGTCERGPWGTPGPLPRRPVGAQGRPPPWTPCPATQENSLVEQPSGNTRKGPLETFGVPALTPCGRLGGSPLPPHAVPGHSDCQPSQAARKGAGKAWSWGTPGPLPGRPVGA